MEKDIRFDKPHPDWADQIAEGHDVALISALTARVKHGHVYFVEALLEKIDTDPGLQMRLQGIAIAEEQFHLFPLFMEFGFEPSLYTMDTLLLEREANALELALKGAAQTGDVKTVKEIVGKHNLRDIEILTWAANYACQNEQLEVLKCLFNWGVNPNDMTMFTNNSIKYTQSYKRLNKIDELLHDEHFFDNKTLADLREPIEDYDQNAIMMAARCNCFDKVVEIALKEKNDTLTVDDLRATDSSNLSVINYLGRTHQLEHLFTLDLWHDRIEDAKTLYNEVPDAFKEQVSLNHLVNLVQIKNAPTHRPPRRRPPKI